MMFSLNLTVALILAGNGILSHVLGVTNTAERLVLQVTFLRLGDRT